MRARRLFAFLALALVALGASALACGSAARGTSDGGPDAATNDAHPSSDARDANAEPFDRRDGGGPASLVALSVSAASEAGAPVSLAPEFEPGIYDYSVRCSEGTNTFTVSMRASEDAESLLVDPTKSEESPEQTLTVNVTEGQAIVAAASRGTTTTEYWVRCLPHDFPRFEWGPHPEAGAPSPGYYLLGTAFAQPTSNGYAMVLDSHGVPVWYAPVAHGVGAVNVDTIVPGTISLIRNPSNGKPYEIHTLKPLGSSSAGSPSLVEDQHELRALSGGGYVVLSSPMMGGIDLTGLVVNLSDGGVESLGPNETIVGCNILELNSSGVPTWQWRAIDHLDPAKDCLVPTMLPPDSLLPDAGAAFDVFHCNSIDVDPANGNLLVSARQLDSIFYIERSTGKILWKMGGSSYTLDNAAYVPVADPFYGQHDARLSAGWASTCAGGNGPISLYDDHSFAPGRERGVIYDVHVELAEGGAPDCGASGDAASSGAALMWQYPGPVSSLGLGSVRVQADGSRVIGWGYGGGPANLSFTEVDSSGHDLLDVSGILSYRAIKVPLTAFDLDVLRDTSGKE
jgi:Arylsulfotransferase (ASST)